MSIWKSTKTCKFCGKTREVTYDDHKYDDEGGRNYGLQETNNDTGCDCQLGQIAFHGYKIKKMCVNCKYLGLMNYCTNPKTKEEISSQFSVKELVVKDKTKKCKNWELSTDAFEDFI